MLAANASIQSVQIKCLSLVNEMITSHLSGKNIPVMINHPVFSRVEAISKILNFDDGRVDQGWNIFL